MFLSLLFRGARGYTLLHGTREVGSLNGSVLRFHPFATETDAIRAADAGYHALLRWLAARTDVQPVGPRPGGAPPPADAESSGDSPPRWAGPDGAPIARLARHPSGARQESHHDVTRAEPAHAVEFVLPEDVYAAVALQPAQRIHEAMHEAIGEAGRVAARDTTADAARATPTDTANAPGGATRAATFA